MGCNKCASVKYWSQEVGWNKRPILCLIVSEETEDVEISMWFLLIELHILICVWYEYLIYYADVVFTILYVRHPCKNNVFNVKPNHSCYFSNRRSSLLPCISNIYHELAQLDRLTATKCNVSTKCLWNGLKINSLLMSEFEWLAECFNLVLKSRRSRLLDYQRHYRAQTSLWSW